MLYDRIVSFNRLANFTYLWDFCGEQKRFIAKLNLKHRKILSISYPLENYYFSFSLQLTERKKRTKKNIKIMWKWVSWQFFLFSFLLSLFFPQNQNFIIALFPYWGAWILSQDENGINTTFLIVIFLWMNHVGRE